MKRDIDIIIALTILLIAFVIAATVIIIKVIDTNQAEDRSYDRALRL